MVLKTKIHPKWKGLFKVSIVLAVIINLAIGVYTINSASNRFAVAASNPIKNRGVILDRNLQPLALNKPLFALKKAVTTNTAIPKNLFKDSKDFWYFDSYEFALQAKQEVISNLDVQVVSLREYTNLNSFASILGYQYNFDGNSTSVGLESKLDAALTQDQNIVTTLDASWTNALYNNLKSQVNNSGAEFGAAAIMNVATGELRAYTNYPSYEPNKFAAGISNQDLDLYLQQPSKPLLDKMLSISSVPGSIYKLSSTISLFKDGKVPLDFQTFSNGCISLGSYPFCEYAKRFLGDLNLSTALTTSSNTYFCLAMQQYLGSNSIESYLNDMQKLGLGQADDFDWGTSQSGVLPSPAYKKLNYKEDWYLGDSCNTVIGQGMVLVTPMQMLKITAGIANQGKIMKPYVVSKSFSQTGTKLSETMPTLLTDLNIDANLLNTINEGMYRVTHDVRGTDYWVLGFAPIDVWAKTGTAEAIKNVNGELLPDVHGWVVGYFKYEDATYAYVVQLQYGKGGWNATPVIKGFLECLISNFSNGCATVQP